MTHYAPSFCYPFSCSWSSSIMLNYLVFILVDVVVAEGSEIDGHGLGESVMESTVLSVGGL